MSVLVFDSDDFGSNHIISEMCQSHDCRKELDALHYANNAFKATLFAIPAEMTYELIKWCKANESWIELAVHGFFHSSNYECEKLTEEEFGAAMKPFSSIIDKYFVKGFKAPGWQISDGAYQWLLKNGWWVACQGYNDSRRPKELLAYVNYDGKFKANGKDVEGLHTHTWNTVGNGIEDLYSELEAKVKAAEGFQFVSEAVNA